MAAGRAIGWLAAGAIACVAGAAEHAGALTCEQVFAVAQTALRYRDQGHSLEQVLQGLKGADAEGKLSPGELEILRRTVTIAYLGQATPEQIALECVRVRGTKKP